LPAVGDSFYTGDKTYYIGMIVDDLNAVTETNEGNNSGQRAGDDYAAVTVNGTVITPFVTVTSPNGGESLLAGSSYNVTWSDNISENVKIDLFKSGVFSQTIFTSTLSDGSESWTLPTNLASGSDYQIKISSITNGSVFDLSNNYFAVNSINTIDLVGTSFVNNDSILKSGNTYNFNFGIQNVGTSNSGAFNVGFYLSKDASITSSDYFLSSSSISSLGAGATTNLFQNLTLANADNSFWNGQGTYYVGMIIDYQNSITETDESNNTRYDSSLISSFNIEFDYTYDSIGWYDASKKAALEAAANVWESIILDEFANTPIGTNTPYVRNPQTDQYIGTNNLYTTTNVIDDIKIFVGAKDFVGSSFANGGSSGYYANETRYTGNDFEPWIGSLSFDNNVNWFVDSTPQDSTVPFDQYDFLSVAVHEIGHILGFNIGITAFSRWVSNSTFIGNSAKYYNGGNAIPLTGDGHIQDEYTFSNYGENAMDPSIVNGKRKLPTVLDIAILDDIGYSVNIT